jgi:S1-C subfamily serine protease
MDFIDELSGAIGGLADRVGPSVVRIGGGWRSGSGVVIANGAVLTNAHNVRTEQPAVVFSDGRRADAEIAGLDIDGDLAVLSVDTGAAPPLDWAEAAPALGSAVFAVTANGGGPRVTVGFVSSVAQAFRGPRGRRISGSVEHTAPLAPGSSGSPLVDRQGRFVGLNTNRLGTGFYLALPADETLRQRIDALQRGESVERPRLGVGIAPSRAARRLRRAVGLPDLDGVLVRDVEAGSPAERAGIQEGDLIVEAAGRPLREPDDLYDALGSVSATDSLQLRVVRGAEERTVEASFAPATADQAEGGAGPVH